MIAIEIAVYRFVKLKIENGKLKIMGPAASII
jgi:hypothetical protein